jgi:uncharacterized protein YecE (DUF72 family)
MAKRPKLEPDRNPTLFEMDKAEKPNVVVAAPEFELSDQERGLLLGTSAFTANGWAGSFYPVGVKSTDYLTYYATKFRTVEIDSTFYGPPAASTVESWYRKTPPSFIFAAKVPQVVTHEKMLANCNWEFSEFVERMSLLKEKLGPLLFQFPHFDKYQFKTAADFIIRLRSFLKTLPHTNQFVVEIRNKAWLNAEFVEMLREHNIALALADTSFMPRPWELEKPLDLITSDFVYVRWLGNRKEIEKRTTTWDKTIIDRTGDLRHWLQLCRRFVAERRVKRLFLFANNHYQGHGPDTVKRFCELWNE